MKIFKGGEDGGEDGVVWRGWYCGSIDKIESEGSLKISNEVYFMSKGKKERFVRISEYSNMSWYKMEKEKGLKRLNWIIQTPFEFVCAHCGRRVVVDSYTYIGKIYGPNIAKKCPICGHMPYDGFYYCSPKCFRKGLEKFGINTHRRRESKIVFEGKVKEVWADERKPEWKDEWRYRFHEEFPKIAKKRGFRVYKAGWPDFLIEKDDKYIAVEVKERTDLAPHQKLMHEALRRAGLGVVVVKPNTDLIEKKKIQAQAFIDKIAVFILAATTRIAERLYFLSNEK